MVIGALECVFARIGVPRIVRSDNGTCFTSREMQEFALEWGFTQSFSSPRYPQSNGMAERAVGTVKRLWSKSADKDGALLAYRSTPLKSGFSPNQLMFGRAVRLTLGKPNVSVDYGLFEEAEQGDREQKTAKWNAKFRAKHLPALIPGQRVWVNAPSDVGKEGVVLRADSKPDSYWVQVGLSEIRRNRKHLFVLHDDSCFSERSVRPLEFEDNNFQTNHDVSVGVPQAFHDCVTPSSATCARVGSPDNQSVADNTYNTSNASNIISASASTSVSNGVQGALNNGSASSDVVNHDIVADTPLAESSPVRPGVTITKSGRVSKPAQRFAPSGF